MISAANRGLISKDRFGAVTALSGKPYSFQLSIRKIGVFLTKKTGAALKAAPAG